VVPVLVWKVGRGSAAAVAFTGSDTQLFEDLFRGAEAGEGGLNQIQSDEPGEEEPPFADPVSEGDTDEDHDSGENSNCTFKTHGMFSFI
jgi:hypothetical protein